MTWEEVVSRLIKIDYWLFYGDKDQAHYLIQSLLKEIYDRNKIKKTVER